MGRNSLRQKGDSTGGVAKRHGGSGARWPVFGQFSRGDRAAWWLGAAVVGIFESASGGNVAGAGAGHAGQHGRRHDFVVVRPLFAALAEAGKPAAQGPDGTLG